jgi:hypothetical protein
VDDFSNDIAEVVAESCGGLAAEGGDRHPWVRVASERGQQALDSE